MRKGVPSMSTVREMRHYILEGYKSKEVAEMLGVSVSVVYSYTKAERRLQKLGV